MSGQPSDAVHRACPVCGGRDAADHLQKEALRLVRCRRCRMLFASPVPREFAEGSYYQTAAAAFHLSAAKRQADFAPVRHARERRLFRRFCAAGAVLDVGCSTGAFLFQLQQAHPACYEAWGTDVAGAALDYAASLGIAVVPGPFLGHDFGSRRFDAVTFWAVLEHLVEPDRFLAKASDLLRPGGHLFLLVPNLESLAVRVLGARYRYILPEHVNYFSARTLSALVARVPGLEPVARGTMHFNPLVIWQDRRRTGIDPTESERAGLLARTTRYKQSPWLGPARLAYGLVEKSLAACGLADNLYLVACKSAGASGDR